MGFIKGAIQEAIGININQVEKRLDFVSGIVIGIILTILTSMVIYCIDKVIPDPDSWFLISLSLLSIVGLFLIMIIYLIYFMNGNNYVRDLKRNKE